MNIVDLVTQRMIEKFDFTIARIEQIQYESRLRHKEIMTIYAEMGIFYCDARCDSCKSIHDGEALIENGNNGIE